MRRDSTIKLDKFIKMLVNFNFKFNGTHSLDLDLLPDLERDQLMAHVIADDGMDYLVNAPADDYAGALISALECKEDSQADFFNDYRNALWSVIKDSPRVNEMVRCHCAELDRELRESNE